MGDRPGPTAATGLQSDPDSALPWTRWGTRTRRASPRRVQIRNHRLIPSATRSPRIDACRRGRRLMIRVEQFAGNEEEWDTFAAAQHGYTHFHRLRWRAVIERTFGHECVYLAARNSDGELIGVLPLDPIPYI